MKSKNIIIKELLLISLSFLIFTPYSYCLEDSTFLEESDVFLQRIYCDVGDRIHWSFKTYNNSFMVMVSVTGYSDPISMGKYSDNGTVTVIELFLDTDYIHIHFGNIDTTDGYIDVSLILEIRIPSYDLIIILGLIALSSALIVFILSRKLRH